MERQRDLREKREDGDLEDREGGVRVEMHGSGGREQREVRGVRERGKGVN